jgi:hypothetical protein
MFKSDWLFGCCTTVKVTVEVKERRIKWLQMNLEGRGYWLLKPSGYFLVEFEQKFCYACNSYWCLVIIISDNYRLSIPADTGTIVWAISLVTTVHANSQTAARVKI